jgi:hypothetical protein
MSTDNREALARLLDETDEAWSGGPSSERWEEHMADAVIAAGWRPAVKVTEEHGPTVEAKDDTSWD